MTERKIVDECVKFGFDEEVAIEIATSCLNNRFDRLNFEYLEKNLDARIDSVRSELKDMFDTKIGSLETKMDSKIDNLEIKLKSELQGLVIKVKNQ